jgi:hypothetical protein
MAQLSTAPVINALASSEVVDSVIEGGTRWPSTLNPASFWDPTGIQGGLTSVQRRYAPAISAARFWIPRNEVFHHWRQRSEAAQGFTELVKARSRFGRVDWISSSSGSKRFLM